MTFDELLDQVCDLLKRQERVSYRALKIRFQLASPRRGSLLAGQVLGAGGGHEPESALAAAGQTRRSAGEELAKPLGGVNSSYAIIPLQKPQRYMDSTALSWDLSSC
jgi:hypothetical protein